MEEKIGVKIKLLRQNLGITQDELAKKAGVAKQTIYKSATGIITNIPSDKIEAMSSVLHCAPSYLMGWEHDKSHCRGVTINVLGRVAAGIPIEAIEDVIDTEEIPEEMAKDGEYFGLQIHGDSMMPRMREGDVVIVRKQDDAETDQIVIALINGNDAVCKRLLKYKDGISLVSNNPAYDPLVFTAEQIKDLPVRIIGKVVECRQKYD